MASGSERDWSPLMLPTFGGDKSKCLCDIVTGDGSWIDQRSLEGKQRSLALIFAN